MAIAEFQSFLTKSLKLDPQKLLKISPAAESEWKHPRNLAGREGVEQPRITTGASGKEHQLHPRKGLLVWLVKWPRPRQAEPPHMVSLSPAGFMGFLGTLLVMGRC